MNIQNYTYCFDESIAMNKYFIMFFLLVTNTYAQELLDISHASQRYHPIISLLYNLDSSNIDVQKPDAYFEMFFVDVLNILREFGFNIKNSESIKPLIHNLIARKSKEEIKVCLANLSSAALI